MTAASALFNLSAPPAVPAGASRAGAPPDPGKNGFGQEMARQRAAQDEMAGAAPQGRPRPAAKAENGDGEGVVAGGGFVDGADGSADAGVPDHPPHEPSGEVDALNGSTLAQQALALAIMSAELQHSSAPGSAAAGGVSTSLASAPGSSNSMSGVTSQMSAATTVAIPTGASTAANSPLGAGTFTSALASAAPGVAHAAAAAGNDPARQAALAATSAQGVQGAQGVGVQGRAPTPAARVPAAAGPGTAAGHPAPNTTAAGAPAPVPALQATTAAAALNVDGAALQPRVRHSAAGADAPVPALPADAPPADAGTFNAPPSAAAAFTTAAQPLWQRDGAVGAPAAQVATPVSHAHWGQDLGRHLVNLTRDLQQASHTAELRLDPPELGPLRVTITLSDGVAQASFVSSHAAVRQALEAALPQLHQALAQAGISLSQTNVGDQGQEAQFANAQQDDSGQRDGSRRPDSAQGEGGRETTAATVMPGPRRAPDALVDTFA